MYYMRTNYFLEMPGFEKEFREIVDIGTQAKEVMDRYKISYHIYRNLLEAYGLKAHKPSIRQ